MYFCNKNSTVKKNPIVVLYVEDSGKTLYDYIMSRQVVFSLSHSMKEQIEITKDSIANKEQVAALLEKHLANLERSLNTMQLRLAKLLPQ